jgi:hypothetical protein
MSREVQATRNVIQFINTQISCRILNRVGERISHILVSQETDVEATGTLVKGSPWIVSLICV